MPTLLDCLGLPVPDGLAGVSLASAIRQSIAPAERPVFCQFSGNHNVGDIRRAVITRRFKYMYDPLGGAELYDLQKDPLEMTNLAPDPPDPAVREFVRSLTETERTALAVRDELYGGSWERMRRDLEARAGGRPYVFKLATRIEEDIRAIEKLSGFEARHGVNLSDHAWIGTRPGPAKGSGDEGDQGGEDDEGGGHRDG
jgi:hypothetical protein